MNVFQWLKGAALAAAVVGVVVGARGEDSNAGPDTRSPVSNRKSGEVILSANALGYAKRTVPAGKWQIVSVPYRNIASEDGRYKFGDTPVAQHLPQGSSVQFWNANNQMWSGGSKGAKGWAAAQANHVIGVGEAFFVKNNSDTDLKVVAAGEVPGQETISGTCAGGGKWSIVAPPYPAGNAFGKTGVADAVPEGSTVLFWDVDRQCWSGGGKSAKGWAAAQGQEKAAAGTGFFLMSGGAEVSWEESKPYAWP